MKRCCQASEIFRIMFLNYFFKTLAPLWVKWALIGLCENLISIFNIISMKTCSKFPMTSVSLNLGYNLSVNWTLLAWSLGQYSAMGGRSFPAALGTSWSLLDPVQEQIMSSTGPEPAGQLPSWGPQDRVQEGCTGAICEKPELVSMTLFYPTKKNRKANA